MADHYEVWKDGKLVSSTPIDTPSATNKALLRERLRAALATNGDFLKTDTPSNKQLVLQVRQLTKENSALIRLALDEIDGIPDVETL